MEEIGFQSVQAIPLPLRRDTIGAGNLFGVGTQSLTDEEMRLGRAMADLATISLLQERSITAGELLAEQLQSALNSRVVVEQAKGVLAERAGLSMEAAFHVSRKLSEVAAEVAAGQLDLMNVAERTRGSTSEPGR